MQGCLRWKLVLFCVVLCSSLLQTILVVAAREKVTVKINKEFQQYNAAAAQPAVQSREPNPFVLPEHLVGSNLLQKQFQTLAGQCVSMTISSATDEYVYTVCPFHNVTQKQMRQVGQPVVFIGIWDQWQTGDDKNDLLMHYTDGPSCSNGVHRNTLVTLKCDENAETMELVSVNEVACSYTMTVKTAAACAVTLPVLCGPFYEAASIEGRFYQWNDLHTNQLIQTKDDTLQTVFNRLPVTSLNAGIRLLAPEQLIEGSAFFYSTPLISHNNRQSNNTFSFSFSFLS